MMLLNGWMCRLRGVFWWTLCVTLPGCGRDHVHTARYAPTSVPVPRAEAYTPKLEPTALDPGSICAAQPERCPNVELITSTQGLDLYGRTGTGGPEILLTGPLRGAPAVGRSRRSVLMAASDMVTKAESKVIQHAQGRRAPEPVRQSHERQALVLRNVEATLEVEVDDISATVLQLRALIQKVGGQLVNEVFEDSESQNGAALSIRVPVDQTNRFLEQVAATGRLRSRKVQATDISRKYLDAEVLLRNLRATLARYEELLSKAEDVADVAGIEASLARLRTQIERVEGDLKWLADSGARSTIYVKLSSAREGAFQGAPEAKLWPEARGVMLFELPGDGFAGGGAGFAFSRAFGFDIAVLEQLDDDVGLFSASLGGDVYSDYLGGGRRRWLNPFLGFRAAYLFHAGLHEAALGATLGLEVLRTEHVMVEAQARGYAAFGSELGLRALVEPSVGVSTAF